VSRSVLVHPIVVLEASPCFAPGSFFLARNNSGSMAQYADSDPAPVHTLTDQAATSVAPCRRTWQRR
jgi:hypothetical protein